MDEKVQQLIRQLFVKIMWL